MLSNQSKALSIAWFLVLFAIGLFTGSATQQAVDQKPPSLNSFQMAVGEDSDNFGEDEEGNGYDPGPLGATATFNPFLVGAPPLDDLLAIRIPSRLVKRAPTPYICDITLPPVASFVIASKEAFEADPEMEVDFVCDGDNDQVEIQAALNNLEESTEKRVVTLLYGVYSINEQIVLPGNVILQGAGMDVTILRLQDNANPFRQAGFIRGLEVDHFVIKDMTIDGNKDGQLESSSSQYGRFGFYCEVCIDMTLENVHFTNHYGYGVDPHGEPDEARYSEYLYIRGCISDNNGWDGYTIDKTKYTTLENSVSENNGRHGINLVTGTLYSTIQNNVIKDNGWYYYSGSLGNGITVQDNDAFGTGENLIQKNTIINSASRGIRDDTGIKGDILKENIIDGPKDCIYALNTVDLTIDSNDCKNGKKVYVEGTREGLVVINQPVIKYNPPLE